MAEEEPKKVETETPSEPPPPAAEPAEASPDVAQDKSVIPPPPTEEKPVESTELAAVESISLLFPFQVLLPLLFTSFCFFLFGLICPLFFSI